MHEIQPKKKKAEEKNEFIYKLFQPDKHLNFLKWVQHIELDNHFLKISSNQTASYEIKKINCAN